MGRTFSQDLRDRVLSADPAESNQKVAKRLLVSAAWVGEVRRRYRDHGESRPRPAGGVKNVKIDIEALKHIVAEKPDATLAEIADLHSARTGVKVSGSGVDAALRRLKISYKKSHSALPSRIVRMSPKPER